MLGHNFFYHSLIRKYVAVFGSLFSDIRVMHNDMNGNMQNILVPVTYGPRARYIERNKADPDLQSNRITANIWPRITYEITGFSYGKDRKLNSLNRECLTDGSVWTPSPWDIQFTLSVISRTNTDGAMIVEQIIPFFTPSLIVSVNLLDSMKKPRDIPITLKSIHFLDTYADDWLSKEFVLYELIFNMEAWMYGSILDTSKTKVIKFANVSVYPTSVLGVSNTENNYLKVLVQPGLTANGQGTTDINQTIPYQQIEVDDPWEFIVRFEEN